MTIINTSEDLLRLLREDAHFYDQARRLILTDELISLPERFAAFAARVDDFITKQEQFNERVDGFIAKQEQFNDEQRQFNRRVEARFNRIEGDLSHFKNRSSESQVAEEAATIAMAMGFILVRVLGNSDLVQMCRHPNARLLPQNDLVSFTRADLVLEVSNQDGNNQFIAVEISYTADQRDTDRAKRNADYITQFTGQPASAAIASARNDQNIQSLIDDGTVWWYPLEDETDGAATC